MVTDLMVRQVLDRLLLASRRLLLVACCLMLACLLHAFAVTVLSVLLGFSDSRRESSVAQRERG